MSKTIQGFNTRLQEALRLKGMKQAELCKRTGIAKASISHYINGVHSPTTDKVYLIAKALGVNEAWLLGYDVPMEVEKGDKNMNFSNVKTALEGMSASELDVLEKYIDYLKAAHVIKEN